MCAEYRFRLVGVAGSRLGTAVLWIALSSGCSALRTPETHIGAAAGVFDAVQITYQQSSGPVAKPAEPASGVQLASYSAPLPAAQPTGGPHKIRTLSLQYPHPDGRVGFALAEVVVEKPLAPSAPPGQMPDNSRAAESVKSTLGLSWFSNLLRDNLPGVAFADGVEEAYALDIPIAEVDQIVRALDAQGYFADREPVPGVIPAGGPMLATRVNGLAVQRQWRSAPELNELVWRVRSEGTLVSHRKPVERLRPAEAATPAPSAAPPAPLITRLPAVVE
jgi:hypothetical protein